MQARLRTRIPFAALALLLLTVASAAAAGRHARRGAPSEPRKSGDQTITLYTAGDAAPEAAPPPSSRHHHHAVFTSQGPLVAHPGAGWLRALTHGPGALRAGEVTIVDEQVHGRKEFGLPLAGRLQGVLITGLADNSSSHVMVAVKASFAGDGAGDSLRFFGVRRDDREESHIAVVGGTGRYSGATGFAIVRAPHAPETGGNVSLSRALSFRVHLKTLK